jgi:hypothetical protein
LREIMAEPEATQTRMKGFKPKAIQEVEDAALKYRKVRNKRMDFGAQENELNEDLVEVMEKHGIHEYQLPDGSVARVVEETTKRAKVFKPKKPKEEKD